MFNNFDIRTMLVDYLKNNSAIIGISSSEVRERQWQGTDFTYPNIRVKIIQQVPCKDVGCNWSDITFSVQCYAEQSSSEQAETIQYAIATFLDKTIISSLVLRVYSIHVLAMPDASLTDKETLTWMAETLFSGKVSAA